MLLFSACPFRGDSGLRCLSFCAVGWVVLVCTDVTGPSEQAELISSGVPDRDTES